MATQIVTDKSKQITWYARQGDDQSLVINFLEDGDPYDVSVEEFTLLLGRFSGVSVLTLTEGDGLTNNGTSLTIEFSAEALAGITSDTYKLFLRSTNGTRSLTWLNGTYILNNGLWDGETTTSESITVNTGDTVLNLSITLSGGGGGTFEIPEYTDLEAEGLPTGVSANYIAQIVCNPSYSVTIDGSQFTNNTIIYFTGSKWISWSGNQTN